MMVTRLFSALALLLVAAPAKADLITYWNFNTLANSTNNGSSYAATTGTGLITLNVPQSNATTGITAFAGSTINAVVPDPAGQALSIQGDKSGGTTSNNGSTITLQFDLTGFDNPMVSLAWQATTTGFNSVDVLTSTDGTTFTPTSFLALDPPGSFALQSLDFSSIDALDGSSTAYVRFVLNAATNQSGNIRLDNIQVNATAAAAVPEPSSMALLGLLAGIGAFGARLKKRKAEIATLPTV